MMRDVMEYTIVGLQDNEPPFRHPHQLVPVDDNEEPSVACEQCRKLWVAPMSPEWARWAK
jgi:hypothetical protein